MTNLDGPLRERLASEWRTRALWLDVLKVSSDGTRKLGLRAADDEVVEAVLIPEERRNTICVSTQVGCPLACSFCATGAHRLHAQPHVPPRSSIRVCRARTRCSPNGEDRITQPRLHGHGGAAAEPAGGAGGDPAAHRPEAPSRWRRVASRCRPCGSGAADRARCSRVGPINLAVSLHATQRRAVRDVAGSRSIGSFPIGRATRRLLAKATSGSTAKRPVFFEYTLIEGVNDSIGGCAPAARSCCAAFLASST